MLLLSRFAVPFLAAKLSLCGLAQSASAAEAYLCAANTIVYVEAQDLELRKRTDPCIAAYYGLTVAAVETPAAPSLKPAPVKRAKTEQKAAKLRRLSDKEVFATSAAPDARRVFAAAASPDTDFRNVRILNPQSPEEAWYRHDK